MREDVLNSAVYALENVIRRFRSSRLIGCRRGAAALEFALVCAPFMIMLFGFIAMNSVFLNLSAMQGNSLNAAMVMATGQITSFQSRSVTCSNSLSATSAEYYACQGLPSWATFAVTASENCTSPATVTVLLSVDGASAALADVYGFFSGRTLSMQSILMKQGTCP
jgi:Flp pilus assembly protein TadG